MQHFIDLFREHCFVTGSAPVEEIGGPIGTIRQQMTIWLNEASLAAGGEVGAGGRR